MKATEIQLVRQGFNLSANVMPAGSHYKHTMRLGRIFPTTKQQALFFLREEINLDVLNMDDVVLIEAELAPYRFIGEYKYTSSNQWVRLTNIEDFNKALRLKFGINE